MFDWDEVPEHLGGPNKAALEIQAEVAAAKSPKLETPADRAARRKSERNGGKAGYARPAVPPDRAKRVYI